MQTFFHSVYQFFYGTIQRWNDFLISLEDDEKQLVPSDYVFPSRNQGGVHAPIKVFQEDGFQYNLGDKKVQFTGNENADKWISDFAILNIDVFHLIQSEQTLPDLQFVKKRYHLLAKQFHPDKNKQTNSQDTILHLNNAYQTISEHLYEDALEQVNLFQSVFEIVLKNVQSQQMQIQPNVSTTPYIVLYLVGVAIGSIIVLKKYSKR